MEPRDLVEELTRRGLAAACSSGRANQIIGGRTRESTPIGIDVYIDGFLIARESGVWVIRMSRRRAADLEMTADSLQEVLRIMLRELGVET